MIPRRLLAGGAQQPWRQTIAALGRGRPAAGRLTQLAGPAARRWTSTNSEPRPYGAFFKTFGRPIAKVSLMAIFAYQVVYYAWTKLAFDENRSERQELSALEDKVKDLQGKQAAETKP